MAKNSGPSLFQHESTYFYAALFCVSPDQSSECSAPFLFPLIYYYISLAAAALADLLFEDRWPRLRFANCSAQTETFGIPTKKSREGKSQQPICFVRLMSSPEELWNQLSERNRYARARQKRPGEFRRNHGRRIETAPRSWNTDSRPCDLPEVSLMNSERMDGLASPLGCGLFTPNTIWSAWQERTRSWHHTIACKNVRMDLAAFLLY